MVILHPALVTAQLLFHFPCCLVKGLMDVVRFGMRLEDQTLVYMGNDIAAEGTARGLAESDIGRVRAAEILLDHAVEAVGDVILQRAAGVDLVPRDADIHSNHSPQ